MCTSLRLGRSSVAHDRYDEDQEGADELYGTEDVFAERSVLVGLYGNLAGRDLH
jgi:hypothetical protein